MITDLGSLIRVYVYNKAVSCGLCSSIFVDSTINNRKCNACYPSYLCTKKEWLEGIYEFCL